MAGSTTGIQLTPVVSNDPSNSGVDWAVTCSLSSNSSTGSCGTLSITTFHSASATPVTYYPPAVLQTGTLTVNVTVFATADHTKNVTTPITITSYASVLSGTYVLQVQGADSSEFPYQTTGLFNFDGNGNITAGQQTINSFSLGTFSSVYTVQGSSGTPSTYFIGADGRGSITLNLQSSAGLVTETLSMVIISSSEALVAELDSNSASGTLELQNSAAATTMPTGAYAFVTNGSDAGSPTGPGFGVPVPTAMGGVFNIDNIPASGSISGSGSLADQDYYNATATTRMLQSCVPPAGVTGSVSQPTSIGIVTITLTGATCFGLQHPASIQFTGYIVDATHIRLIESDDLTGSGGFLTAGIAVNQGSAAGTFTAASLAGPYVYGVLGYDINLNVPSSFTSAGVINADGTSMITGIDDTFYPGDGTAYTANAFTGRYSVDANQIGRADLGPRFSGPSPQPQFSLLAYLTGDGTPPLLLWSEGEDPSFPAIGTGIAYPQAANASSLSFGNPETYGLSFTQNSGSEVDGTGDFTSTVIISGATGRLTGTVDDFNNNIFSGGAPVPILDSFALPADSFGRIAGTFLNVAGSPGPYVEYYLVDDNQGFFVETDLLNSSQVTLGSFYQACDVTSATACQTAAAISYRKHTLKGHKFRSLRKNSVTPKH
ncbi:MAG: hypothetical protein WBV69_04585 [Candidatus Sulfotelmatobacter sp.]